VVFYGEGQQRGVVRDAYGPLDEFWVADERTDALVRDADGEIIAFKSKDLQLAAPLPAAEEKPQIEGIAARVLLVGTEEHMLRILEHFGCPDMARRHDPQQLLAIPCSSCRCGPQCARFDAFSREMCCVETCPMLHVAVEGIDENMRKLGASLRDDIHVGVRAFHIKQAIEQLGPDLQRLEGYYCLSAVTVPFSREEIEATSGWERYWREEVRCQIDLGASASAAHAPGEESPEATARRALRDYCGVTLSDALWQEEGQFRLRHHIGIDLPLKFWDGPDTKAFVLVLPPDAYGRRRGGALEFTQPPGGEYDVTRGPDDGVEAAGAPPPPQPAGGPSQQGGGDGGGKTISQWRLEQDQFKDLPKLPDGWIRIKSRHEGGEIYYYDTKTQKSSLEFPLPEGWTKQVSKTTGKTYYFHAKRRKSQFDVPTE